MGAGLQRATAAAKRTRYENTPAPAVGQIWRDCDPRSKGREVIINTIEGEHAVCLVMGAGTKKTRIKLSRFVPTASGYKYMRDGVP